jgi:Concanavalin A-like lectin/glucanases superfamily
MRQIRPSRCQSSSTDPPCCATLACSMRRPRPLLAGGSGVAGALGNGVWGYIVGTYDKDAGTNNQRLYLNGTRVPQMSDAQPIDLNAAALGIGRHVSGIADPFNGHIDEFRIVHVQRSDGWIATTWNNMSDPGAFALAGPRNKRRPATAGRCWCGRLPDGRRAFGAELTQQSSAACAPSRRCDGHRRAESGTAGAGSSPAASPLRDLDQNLVRTSVLLVASSRCRGR